MLLGHMLSVEVVFLGSVAQEEVIWIVSVRWMIYNVCHFKYVCQDLPVERNRPESLFEVLNKSCP